jgi:superfamily II DNA helicase RecQ
VLQFEERIAPKYDLAQNLARLLQEKTFNHMSYGIIFCISIAEVNAISESFGGLKSYSELLKSDQLQLQQEWFYGLKSQWMVATTGFLHGINHPHVDAVIFVGLPYGLTNFVQGVDSAKFIYLMV